MHLEIALQQKFHLDHLWMQKHVFVKLSSVQQGSDTDVAQSEKCMIIPVPLQKLASVIFQKHRWNNFS